MTHARSTRTVHIMGLLIALCSVPVTDVAAQLSELPAKPRSVRKVVSDGRHNAFAAFVKWKGQYWLAFRKGTGHVARDGDLVVLKSTDARQWHQSISLDIFGDDRDAQLLPTRDRLILYINSLKGSRFNVFVSYTTDGKSWSEPQQVYRDGFILWKPVEHQGRFYAGSHRPGGNAHRLSHLVTSTDGIDWKQLSTIRAAQGESETAILFQPDGRLTAFLRSQVQIGGFILEAKPPYNEWSQRPAAVHLSGHAAYRFNGVTYLISRRLNYDASVSTSTPVAEVRAAGKTPDQTTMIYTYESGRLKPYCLLGPLDGNHDSSYATAIAEGNEMLVVYHRAAHAYGGEFRFKDAADLFLARVPLAEAESNSKR